MVTTSKLSASKRRRGHSPGRRRRHSGRGGSRGHVHRLRRLIARRQRICADDGIGADVDHRNGAGPPVGYDDFSSGPACGAVIGDSVFWGGRTTGGTGGRGGKQRQQQRQNDERQLFDQSSLSGVGKVPQGERSANGLQGVFPDLAQTLSAALSRSLQNLLSFPKFLQAIDVACGPRRRHEPGSDLHDASLCGAGFASENYSRRCRLRQLRPHRLLTMLLVEQNVQKDDITCQFAMPGGCHAATWTRKSCYAGAGAKACTGQPMVIVSSACQIS